MQEFRVYTLPCMLVLWAMLKPASCEVVADAYWNVAEFASISTSYTDSKVELLRSEKNELVEPLSGSLYPDYQNVIHGNLNTDRPLTTRGNLDTDRPMNTNGNLGTDRSMTTHSNLDTDRPMTTHSNVNTDRPMTTLGNLDTDRPMTMTSHSNLDTDRPMTTHSNLDTDHPMTTHDNLDTVHPMTTHSNLDTDRTMTTNSKLDTDRPMSTRGNLDTDRPMTTHSNLDTDQPMTTHDNLDTHRPMTTKSKLDTDRPMITNGNLDTDRPMTTHSNLDTDRPMTTLGNLDTDRPMTSHTNFDTDRPMTTHSNLDTDRPMTTHGNLNTDHPMPTHSNLDTDQHHQGIELSRKSCFSSSASKLYYNATLPGHYQVTQIKVVGSTYIPGSSLKGITVYLDNIPTELSLNGRTNTATITPKYSSVQNISISRPQTGNDKLIICDLHVMQAAATNIANSTSLEASPSFIYNGRNYTKGNAVDGNIESNEDTCNCCYRSQKSQSPYLQADLQSRIPVRQIVIEGSADRYHMDSNLVDVTIQLDGTIATPDSTSNSRRITVTPHSPVRVIRIERRRASEAWYLMVCELQIFVPKCGNGYWGYWCNDTCPNCIDSCDQLSGDCIGGCKAGWYGRTCDVPCRNGTFGAICAHTCHCKDDAPCNNSDGHCENSCAAGWSGFDCSQACPTGNFGDGCAHTCRCKNNAGCDKTTGQCTNGCDYGWTGYNCSTNLNLLLRIMDSLNTSMSSTLSGMGASLALDGRYDLTNDSLSVCHCCSVTSDHELPWWQLDLGKLYLIQEIYVIGRINTGAERSLQLISSISNSSIVSGNMTASEHPPIERHLLNLHHSVGSPAVHQYRLDQPTVFRYLTVSQQRQSIMAICEVILIEGACPAYTFGHNCQHSCGSCNNNATCDSASGECSDGCAVGFNGKYCSGTGHAGLDYAYANQPTNRGGMDHAGADYAYANQPANRGGTDHGGRSMPVAAIAGCAVAGMVCILIGVVLVRMLKARRASKMATRKRVPDTNSELYITPVERDSVYEAAASNHDYDEISDNYHLNDQDRYQPYGTTHAF